MRCKLFLILFFIVLPLQAAPWRELYPVPKPTYATTINGIFAFIHNKPPPISLPAIRQLLLKNSVRTTVANYVVQTIKCARKYRFKHGSVLTIIDYTQPSNTKCMRSYEMRLMRRPRVQGCKYTA